MAVLSSLAHWSWAWCGGSCPSYCLWCIWILPWIVRPCCGSIEATCDLLEWCKILKFPKYSPWKLQCVLHANRPLRAGGDLTDPWQFGRGGKQLHANRPLRWGSDRSVTDPGQFGRGEKQLTRLRDWVTENVLRLGPAWLWGWAH